MNAKELVDSIVEGTSPSEVVDSLIEYKDPNRGSKKYTSTKRSISGGFSSKSSAQFDSPAMSELIRKFGKVGSAIDLKKDKSKYKGSSVKTVDLNTVFKPMIELESKGYTIHGAYESKTPGKIDLLVSKT